MSTDSHNNCHMLTPGSTAWYFPCISHVRLANHTTHLTYQTPTWFSSFLPISRHTKGPLGNTKGPPAWHSDLLGNPLVAGYPPHPDDTPRDPCVKWSHGWNDPVTRDLWVACWWYYVLHVILTVVIIIVKLRMLTIKSPILMIFVFGFGSFISGLP